MKVLIDLIEDIREAIQDDPAFTMNVMQLQETKEGQFTPVGESNVALYKVDDTQKKLFLFLGKTALNALQTFQELNSLSNEAMMYEVKVSDIAAGQRVDQEIIGFGESLQDKKYLLFIQAA